MKYIKKYEVTYGRFKEDDYIIIKNSDRIKMMGEKYDFYPHFCVKIIQVIEAYYVETFDEKTNKDLIFWILDEDIERKATKEEIEEYIIKRSSIKYNL